MKEELCKMKGARGHWREVFADAPEVEIKSVMDDVNRANSFPLTPEVLSRLAASGEAVHILDRNTGFAHALDLVGLVKEEPHRWATPCGWKFVKSEVVLQVGAVPAGRCTKRGCADRLKRIEEMYGEDAECEEVSGEEGS